MSTDARLLRQFQMPWEGYAEYEHIDDSRTEEGALDCSLWKPKGV